MRNRTGWRAAITLAAALVLVASATGQAAAHAGSEDTCTLNPLDEDASDNAGGAEPILADGSCFGTIGRAPADDAFDWYRRLAPTGNLDATATLSAIDVTVCDEEQGGDSELVLQLYWVERGDDGPDGDDRVALGAVPEDGCVPLSDQLLPGQSPQGGSWLISVSGIQGHYTLATALS